VPTLLVKQKWVEIITTTWSSDTNRGRHKVLRSEELADESDSRLGSFVTLHISKIGKVLLDEIEDELSLSH